MAPLPPYPGSARLTARPITPENRMSRRGRGRNARRRLLFWCPVLATWYIRSKKDGLGLLEHSYPLTRNPIEGQGNRFFSLDGERSSFDGSWTYTNNPLGPITPLIND